MSNECRVCGRPLRASTGIGPKCARKVGLDPSPASRQPPSATPIPVHPDQTTIPIQPELPKEN
ncbi:MULTISPECIES: hypothetical protein [unclassified Streptomyces]|uniref:hypothetical protein n=1 Tax=unclassified Streptomyces TaxID=2593676 RepID=UPI0033ACD5CA